MKNKRSFLMSKKFLVFSLHGLFLLLVMAGISIMYLNSHYGKGIGWLFDETYEDTSAFSYQLQSDIDEIFDYIRYRDIFEINGKLDYSAPMVRISGTQEKSYTLADLIRHAKSRGLYLDKDFKISGQQIPLDEESEEEVHVEWRAYDPTRRYHEPGDAYATLDSLSEEVLTHLGNYYSFYYRFIQKPSNFRFIIYYQNSENGQQLYTNTPGASIEQLMATGKYIYTSSDTLNIESNLDHPPENITSLLEAVSLYEDSDYSMNYMIASIDTSYQAADTYYTESFAYNQMRTIYISGLISLCTGLAGCLVTLILIIKKTGYVESDKGTIKLHQIDRFPLELCFFLCALLYFFLYFLSDKIADRLIHLILARSYWYFAEEMLHLLIIYFISILFLLSIVRRLKSATIWKNSLCCNAASSLSLYFKDHRFTTRIMISYLTFICFQILSITIAYDLFNRSYFSRKKLVSIVFIIFYVLVNWYIFHLLYRNAKQTDLINEALLKISEGNTSYKINTDDFGGKEKEIAENINHISGGLETALQEKVKSERLKTDLITNVSHDIKTPLTSIINYVDLIKREQIPDQKIQGYLDVLEQKSQRLKTLTEDLVEASKASSGNLKLDISDIDFVELILQSNGEFKEKFELRHLELISNLPDRAIIIQADGRYLWRVLENLYNNAYKYAMEHSRIYIDITETDQAVSFTIKNISEHSLNIHADELTERFVRGDVARTTEGSGLGLAIAKSLTELQNGSFSIHIDGDLFKVQIAFSIKPI